MGKYINTEKIEEIANHAFDEWNKAMIGADTNREVNLCFKRQELCRCITAIAKNLPAEDVEPVVHAKWICDTPNFPVMGLYRYHCSFCDRDIWVKDKMGINNYPYCHCGAKMKKEEG